jgi:two-component system chemotaxis sensor kinase CheA
VTAGTRKVKKLSLDVDQYRQLFIEEAKEHIQTLTKSLLILEKNPANTEVLNMLFRSAHTLKGSSAMMDFKDFSELTHAMEDVFDAMRKGKQPSSDLISTLLECVDALTSRLNRIENKVEGEIEIASFMQRLREPSKASGNENESDTEKPHTETEMELTDDEKKTARQAVEIGDKCLSLNITFTDDCVFKSIRANMVLDKISEVAKVLKTFPSRKDIDENKVESGFKIVVTSRSDEKRIEECAKSVCEIDRVDVSSVKISSVQQKEPRPVSQGSDESKILAEARSAQTVRVHFDQLDKLMNWVGELAINRIALLQITSDIRHEGLKRIAGNIDRLTADLQDLVMQVRMVPVSQVFDRFPRLVRDLSIKKGKKIDLEMEGREIEVDRTVLDEIGEPLIHLLRNSIDHGIENPDERKRSGKSETGVVRLSAQRKGDNVIIEVDDNGAGIDPERVKQSAVQKGFVSQAEAEKMNKDQLINLVFLPGLSTAKEVSETSGRGVGMDVVKTKVASLGGTVHLETQVGTGTRVTIKLPLTLAIIQAILVKDSGQTFAVPASQVSEIVRTKKKDIKSLGTFEAIDVRRKVIPVLHLHNLLNLEKTFEPEECELLVTYAGHEETKLGLAVDSVVRQQDVLIKSLDENLSNIRGVSGVTILGDGQVVLVLDVAQFTNRRKDQRE